MHPEPEDPDARGIPRIFPKDYLRTHDLRYVGLGDERYLCRKDDRTTIVAPVRVDGIDECCAFVNSLDELGRFCEKLAL
jgi:hypothetical protein